MENGNTDIKVQLAGLKKDIENADLFVASLIFIEDLAQKVVEAVEPHKENLKAAVVPTPTIVLGKTFNLIVSFLLRPCVSAQLTKVVILLTSPVT